MEREMTVREFASMGGRARAKKLSKKRRHEIGVLAGSAPRRKSNKICAWCERAFRGRGRAKWCSIKCKGEQKRIEAMED